MKFKKYYLELVALPLLIAAFLITRFYNILSLPIFTDEAIYIRWAQIANFDSSWRFISLTDGKQPSFVWFTMIMMRFFSDPLLAGRVVSVVAGLGTVVGIYFVALELFKKLDAWKKRVIAMITVVLYVISPFTLLYDRLAIYDSLVACLFVWSLYFQIRLVRILRFDHAMVLGFVLGWAVLTKSIGFLSIYLTPFLFIIFDWRRKLLKNRLGKSILYFGIAAAIAYGMYSILRLSPYFHMINQKNSIFIYSVGEWLSLSFADKFSLLISNSRGLLDWLITYVTVPILLLVLLAFWFEKKITREKLLLLLWFLLPFLSLCFMGRTLYPRYILFMVIPLMPLAALALYDIAFRMKGNALKALVVLLFVCYVFYKFVFVQVDIARSPIPKIDLEQLINGWPAGGGVMESIEFFKAESQKGEIMVGTQGTFGLMPAAYEIYLKDNPNVRINGFWPVESNEVPFLLQDYAKRIPTYLVFYQPCPECDFPGDAPDGLNLEQVATYKKGVGKTFLTIYRVRK